jgi:hypothetical protein
MPAPEPCPNCGTLRRDGDRYCSSCKFDFESLSYRYRDTEFSGQNYGYGGAGTAAIDARPDRPVRTAAQGLLRMFLFYAGIVMVGGALLWGIRSGAVPNIEFTGQEPQVAMIVTFMLAGIVSLIIPGRFARGLGKGCLVGFVSWFIVAAGLYLSNGILLTGIGSLQGLIEHTLAAIAGASIFRLALLPLGVDG